MLTTKNFEAVKKEVLAKEHERHDLTDGVKIHFNSTDWVMLRPSGTEPVVRVYVQASSREKGEALLSEYKKILAD